MFDDFWKRVGTVAQSSADQAGRQVEAALEREINRAATRVSQQAADRVTGLIEAAAARAVASAFTAIGPTEPGP